MAAKKAAILGLFVVLLTPLGWGQRMTVTATVRDSPRNLYQNCTYSVNCFARLESINVPGGTQDISPDPQSLAPALPPPGAAIQQPVNGVSNGSQSLLNLDAGSNISLSGNRSGTVTINASGGGGGGVIGGALAQGRIPKAATTGANTNVQDTTMHESGSPPVVHVPRFENVRYTDEFIWTPQAPAGSLTGGVSNTVTLSPCPKGVDTTGDYRLGAGYAAYGAESGYMVHLAGGSNAEDVFVMGGSCKSGAASGTIIFTPVNSYSNGYTVRSSSSGIQEAINDGCGIAPAPRPYNVGCHIIVPPNPSITAYPITGTIFFHASLAKLSGYGAFLSCTTRRPCLQVGVQYRSQSYIGDTVEGLTFISPTDYASQPAYNGCLISSTQRTSGVITITTASPCGFVTGDMVTILWTDNRAYWGDVPYITVTGRNTFTYRRPSVADIPLQTTPGAVALAYDAILDNAQGTHFIDIQGTEFSQGYFSNFFDFWDDEQISVDSFDNGATALRRSANWIGSFVFSGPQNNLPDKAENLAPVISLTKSQITAQYSACGTVLNSNGVYIHDTICEASGAWQWNIQGAYHGAEFDNIYAETSVAGNPASSALSPWPGTGIAGFICKTGAGTCTYRGEFAPLGAAAPVQTGGKGTTALYYYLVVHDTTASVQTGPILIYQWNSTGSDSPVIPWARWANAADTITYDLIRTTAIPNGINLLTGGVPYNGACLGGSPTACGSVVTRQAQCSGFVCSYTDSAAANTTSYAVANANWVSQQIEFFPATYGTTNIPLLADREPQYPVVATGANGNPAVVADYCAGLGVAVPGSSFDLCLHSPTASYVAQIATLLTDGAPTRGTFPGITKGRLNFTGTTVDMSPHHIITLVDSNGNHTKSLETYRPLADTADSYIGIDQPASGTITRTGISYGAPVSHSFYINNVGDNTSWKFRITGSLISMAEPVAMVPFTATLGTGAITAGTCAPTVTVAATGTTTSSVVTWSYGASPVGVSGYAAGGLTVFAWPAAGNANFAVCNPTGGTITAGPMTLNFRVVN